MDYSRIYDDLIARARTRTIDGYLEKHHVIPRCQGGTDDESNIVSLTPEEHFLAHHILVKINPGHRGLIWACYKMRFPVGNRPSRKLYGWLKRRHSEVMRASSTGPGNTQFGTRWITDGVASKKVSVEACVPPGWNPGRTLAKRSTKKKHCVICGVPTETRKRTFCSVHFAEHVREKGIRLQKFASNKYVGRIFITNGLRDITIPDHMDIPEGWRRGRSNNGKRPRDTSSLS